MAPSRRTVLTTGAAGLVTAAASANAQTTGQGSPPQPMRPGRGGTDPGPRNIPIEMQNPDIFVPPPTDHGTVANLKFPFSASHMRLERGGWTRQVTERELGISKEIAGVNMRLKAGGVRELHWHKPAEWAYMLKGRARITAIDEEGRDFQDDVGEGDLWNFPYGHPALDPGPGGRRLRVPARLRRRQLQRGQHLLAHRLAQPIPPERSWPRTSACPSVDFGNTPGPSELYIFPPPVPGPLADDRLAGAGPVPNTFSHRLMAQEPIRTKGGTRAHRRFQELPGLDHHRGRAGRDQSRRHARAALASRTRTSGSTTSKARAGWACSPRPATPAPSTTRPATSASCRSPWATTSRTPATRRCASSKCSRAATYADVSLNRWMALTPPELVQGTLKLDRSVMSALRRGPAPVVPV